MDVLLIDLTFVLGYNLVSIIAYLIAIIVAKRNGSGKIGFWIGFAAGIIAIFGAITGAVRESEPILLTEFLSWIFFAVITIFTYVRIKKYSTLILENSNQVVSAATLPPKDIPSPVMAKEKVDVMTDIPDGGWRCSNCGKVHYSYETSCSCGKSIFDSASIVKKKEAVIPTIDETLEENSMNTVGQKDNTNTELSPFDVIRKYKELLDEGIITQEEFDTKKKQLLGL